MMWMRIFFCSGNKIARGSNRFDLDGYQQYWNYAVKKAIQGLLFYEKYPLSVAYGIGIKEHNQEGRVITLEFEDFYLVNIYTQILKEVLQD